MADIIVPASLTTTLQAVNTMIMSLGEAQVDTIDPPPHQDAADALSYLNNVDLELQARGWFWNTEERLTLERDGDLHIPVPAQTLWCGPAFDETGYADIVQRGSFMYDRAGHTLVFTRDIYVDIMLRLDWDSLPQAARTFIMLTATQRFQATKQASQIVLQVNARDIQNALVTMEQREDDDRRNNTTYATSTLLAIQGIGGMRRSRFGIR